MGKIFPRNQEAEDKKKENFLIDEEREKTP